MLIGLAVITSPVAAQQSGTAGIYGSVVDAQAAAIPGAMVTLTQLDRNQDREAAANGVGEFVFPLIPVGTYRIRVQHPGFKAFEQVGILLQVNDNRKIDVTLDVGDINTRVQVEANAVAVETSNATIKNVVDGKRVLELPLNGRNVLQLGLLVPGVTSAGGSLTGQAKSPADTQLFSMNGSRQNNVKYTLDGGDNMDNLTNINNPYPFPDAVAEFSVQTSSAGAEIGKSSAGAVNVVTKGGTNEFHGSGFWFVRNSALNASSYFLHQSDFLKRNQTGFAGGGPIRRDKLFFYGGFQRTWTRTVPAESKTLTMPAAHRQGDFSDLLLQTKPIVIKDPSSGLPFPDNTIPSVRFSPAAQNLIKYSPAPGPDGYTRWRSASLEDPKDYILRIDWRPNTRHSILARYLQNSDVNNQTFDPNNLHSVSNTQPSFSKSATVGYTLVVSPNVIFDTHATMSRTLGERWNDFPHTIADFGVNINPSSNQLDVSMNGTSGLGLSTGNSTATFARTNLEWTHSWRWIKGRHNMVGGVDLMFSRYNEYNHNLGAGRFAFNGRYTGFDQADYILGLLSGFSQSNGEIEFRRYHYQGFYFSDAFRITRHLTLNYGLRWEPYTPMTDLNDRQVQFRQDEYLKGTRSTRYVNAPPGMYYPGDVVSGYTIPKAGVEAGKKQFAPRIGLAWDVTGNGKTSLRTGYGIFYDSPMMMMLNNMNVQTPFSFTVAFTDGYFDDPYRGRTNFNVFPFSGDFATNTTFQIPTAASVYQPNWRQPYTQNWNLTLEHSIATWVFQASYVGAKATNLTGNYDMNAPIYDSSKTLQQNQATVNQRRPMPQYQRVMALFNGLNSIYNSFQLSINKRFSRGFSIQSAYTFSRAIDQFSTNNEINSQVMQNPFNFHMVRGLSNYDHTHRLTTSFVWSLPKLGKTLKSRALGIVTDDWQFSGICSASTGAPFGINSTNDAMASAGTAFASLVGNLALPSGRRRGDQIMMYFNTAAVAQAQPGTYGNLGRNVMRYPSNSGADVSMTRMIPLKFRESANLTFRTEFFGLFNHPQLGAPNTSIGQSTFGTISSVGGTRVLQMSLKVGF